MMGYGYGMGAGGLIAMTIFGVALITLVVWGVSRARTASSGGGAESTAPRGGGRDSATGTAEGILDRRFAAGELDEDTYHSMLATLRSSPTTRTEPR